MARPSDYLFAEQQEGLVRGRRWLGLLAAPLAAAALWAAHPDNMRPEAARLMALTGGTLVLWVTEALPLAVTALVAPAVGVLLGIASAKAWFAPFAHPLIFVFLGAFVLARGAEVTRLDRLLAAWLIRRAKRSVHGLLLTIAAATAALSGIFSNTATTAMMVHVVRTAIGKVAPRMEAAALLTLAYAASIGGVLTPIGTAPNLIAVGVLSREVDVPFLQWMLVGVPLGALMLGIWLAMLTVIIKRHGDLTPATGDAADRARETTRALRVADNEKALWGLDHGQLAVVAVLVLAALGWAAPGVVAVVAGARSEAYLQIKQALPVGVVAILAAAPLFILPGGRKRGATAEVRGRPVLTWPQAVTIDWGTILLVGGGLALGAQANATGLASWLGSAIVKATGVQSELGLVLLFGTSTVILTEFASNTATAAILCQLAVMTSKELGVSPVAPCMAAAFGASMAFLMPISTPPNAIVYGTGRVPLRTMVRYGVWVDLAALVTIPPCVLILTRLAGLR